ncbi:MAG: hypothetical protein KC933_12745 [Myxococcales bacterium]|nr:hypothetical protein [Myxococcales bacterium]MCB9647491.1 hypothetical protein [Deltaproteobacteria bacterium]
MGPKRLGVVALACLGLWTAPAQAKLLDDTSALGAGHLSLALGAEAGIVSPNPIRLELHERVGLVGGVGLFLDQYVGLHNEPGARLGGGFKWSILSKKSGVRPGLALWAGGFYQTARRRAGAQGAFMVDYAFGRVTPYAALDLDLWFDDGVDARTGFLGGVRVAIVPHIALFVEGEFGLSGRTKNHLAAAGLRLSI